MAKTNKKATEDEKEKRRLATKRCREKQALELKNLEARKKMAMDENANLLKQIRAIEMLMAWMQKAVAARQSTIAHQQSQIILQ